MTFLGRDKFFFALPRFERTNGAVPFTAVDRILTMVIVMARKSLFDKTVERFVVNACHYYEIVALVVEV